MAAAAVSLIRLASLRDLQWRARRIVVAVLGAALVFAITLLLSGFRATFDIEAGAVIRGFGAAGYVVPQAAEGPFSAGGLMPAAVADQLVQQGLATRADPVITGRRPITAPRRQNAYVIGHRIGGYGTPAVQEGRPAGASGEAVVDSGTGYHVGDTIELGSESFRVVGRVSGNTIFFGIPLVYVPIEDAQRAIFGGEPLATSVLTDRVVEAAPAGLKGLDAAAARHDLVTILGAAVTSVSVLKVFLWFVAGAIIASVLYVSVIERTRDFAVFKATGVRSAHLAVAIAVQAVVLSLVATALACVLALAALPAFPAKIVVPGGEMVLLGVIAVVVGLGASLVALRRAVGIDPAAAFQGP